MNSPDVAARAEAPDLRNFSGLLTLVGAGKMGGALLQGWLRFGIDPAQLAVLEPVPSSEISALGKRGVRLNPDTATLRDVAAIVVAVKPQVAGDVLPRIAPMIAASTVVVSIMAGRTLRFLAGALQTSCALVPRPPLVGVLRSPCRSAPTARSVTSRTVSSVPPARSNGSTTRH